MYRLATDRPKYHATACVETEVEPVYYTYDSMSVDHTSKVQPDIDVAVPLPRARLTYLSLTRIHPKGRRIESWQLSNLTPKRLESTSRGGKSGYMERRILLSTDSQPTGRTTSHILSRGVPKGAQRSGAVGILNILSSPPYSP